MTGVGAVRVVCRQRATSAGIPGGADQGSTSRRGGFGAPAETSSRLVLAGEQPRRLGVARGRAALITSSLGDSGLSVFQAGHWRLAAAALGAGGEVEQALPGEVLDLADAERGVLVELLDVLEVDRLAADPDRLQRAEARCGRPRAA